MYYQTLFLLCVFVFVVQWNNPPTDLSATNEWMQIATSIEPVWHGVALYALPHVKTTPSYTLVTVST